MSTIKADGLRSLNCWLVNSLNQIYIFFRQRQLEEALLFAGQFSEALQALLDWLGKVEPTLGEDQPVHGDIDTVNNLMESHKVRSRRNYRCNHLYIVLLYK